ncbi:hypothetical protein DFQ30_005317, partial [Apophysomyces sp. BC1015]
MRFSLLAICATALLVATVQAAPTGKEHAAADATRTDTTGDAATDYSSTQGLGDTLGGTSLGDTLGGLKKREAHLVGAGAEAAGEAQAKAAAAGGANVLGIAE